MGKKGFVRAGFVPSKLNLNTGEKEDGGVCLGKNGRAFLLEHDEERNKYLYHGMVAFYRYKVPEEFDEEFTHLYEAKEKIFDKKQENVIALNIIHEFIAVLEAVE